MNDAAWVRLLEHGALELDGRVLSASNATFVGDVSLDGESTACVYKPIRGERPLWDFPDGTLALRERAAYVVSTATGAGLVPPTVLREGPFGRGMCQRWVEEDLDAAMVDIVPAGDVADGWLRILDAEDQHRRSVSLVHRDAAPLQLMAVYDAVINNADRKGGHVICESGGSVYGVDHGVSFHGEDKLRTVLWGWAGEPLTAECTELLHRCRDAFDTDLSGELAGLLAVEELVALSLRVDALLDLGRFPVPSGEWPAIPWPAF